MVMPPGHALSLRTPRRMGPREKRIVAAMGALVAVLIVAVAVALLTGEIGRAHV